MPNDRSTKRDIRAVARVLGIKYTAAMRLIEKRELAPGFDSDDTDYRNMTDEGIREIFGGGE